MFKIIINKITSGAITKAEKKLALSLKKKFKEIYELQNKKFMLERKKLKEEISLLKKKENKFLDDKEFIEDIFANKSEEFHDLAQQTASVFQQAMVSVNEILYQKIVPILDNTENKFRIVDKKLIKDNTNVKIFNTRINSDKKILKISEKENKKKIAL
ncbi:MAG: hypothetical protein ACTSQG_00300 [Promethearchaeota archaeon]